MIKEDVATTALRQVKEVFDEYDIEYWLDMGTLLGAIRDGKFIPWDTDIDLGIWHKNIDRIITVCKELHKKFDIIYYESHISVQKEGFPIPIQISLYRLDKEIKTWPIAKNFVGKIILYLILPGLTAPHYNQVHFKASLTTNNLVKIMKFSVNIFIFKTSHALPTEVREKLIRIVKTISKKIGCKYVYSRLPKNYFMNLSTIKFYGMEFRIPARAEEYLTCIYGKDWCIPNKDYVYYRDIKTKL